MRRRNIAACALVALATFGAKRAGGAAAARPLARPALAARGDQLGPRRRRRRAAARERAADERRDLAEPALARAGYLDHTSPDGSTLVDRLARVRWRGIAAGEDLAVAGAPGDAVAMWLRSPGHRENLLRPSFRRRSGSASRAASGTGASALYVTADFASLSRLASRGRRKFPRLRGFGPSRNDARGPITGCA